MRPRDAASLVVSRGHGGETKVLLGRRPSNDRFMPGVHVFPGGRVDRADAGRAIAAELQPAVARRLGRCASIPQTKALAVAALRETHEETGLVFGRLEGDLLLPDLSRLDYLGRAITPSGSPIRYHARFLHARVEDASGELRSNGELLDLDWYSIDEALGLNIIDVTERILEQLRDFSAGRRPDDVFVHYRRQRQHVRREPPGPTRP